MRWAALLIGLVLIAFVVAVAVRARQLREASAQAMPLEQAAAPTPPAAPSSSVAIDDNDPLGLPVSRSRRLQVLHKPHFTIGYDNERREPAWVSYHLSGPIRFHGKEHRPDHFAPDPDVKVPAHHEDYTHSGYDRGHMAPAYAMFSRFGPDGMAETFITSNIIPQRHVLNAGPWEKLEQLIAGRDGGDGGWAEQFGDVWVTDGPVMKGQYGSFPAGEVIPGACFMIVLRRDGERWNSLAFEMPNTDAPGPSAGFLVSIWQIEKETGLNFDPALPSEATERSLEAEPAEATW